MSPSWPCSLARSALTTHLPFLCWLHMITKQKWMPGVIFMALLIQTLWGTNLSPLGFFPQICFQGAGSAPPPRRKSRRGRPWKRRKGIVTFPKNNRHWINSCTLSYQPLYIFVQVEWIFRFALISVTFQKTLDIGQKKCNCVVWPDGYIYWCMCMYIHLCEWKRNNDVPVSVTVQRIQRHWIVVIWCVPCWSLWSMHILHSFSCDDEMCEVGTKDAEWRPWTSIGYCHSITSDPISYNGSRLQPHHQTVSCV